LCPVFFEIAAAPGQKGGGIEGKFLVDRMVEKELVMILLIIIRLVIIGEIVIGAAAGIIEVQRVRFGEIKRAQVVCIMVVERRLIAGELGFRDTVPGLVSFFLAGEDIEAQGGALAQPGRER